MQTETKPESLTKSVPSMRPYLPDTDIHELLEGFEQILRSGRLTMGKYTQAFEEQFARYVGTQYAIATNSGTSSLEAIYRAIGVKGHEVITPTNTHIATSNAVLFAGGTPILADIDESSLCISVEDVRSKITTETKALVVVHVAGLIHPRMRELVELCDKHDIYLIEDAAHAHGATVNGKKAGSLGDSASFSFYPAKVITTVEGGMITTDDAEVRKIASELRNHGSDSRGLQVRLGYNWRMSEMHSCIGLVQLRRIDEIVSRKNRIANIYKRELSGDDRIRLIEVPHGTVHSYYKYPVTLKIKTPLETIQKQLKDRFRVETGSIYYPPCHLQPVYLEMFPQYSGRLPVSEDVLARTIALPIFAEMSEEDAEYVSSSLLTVLRETT
jgi:perosamine synthetase